MTGLRAFNSTIPVYAVHWGDPEALREMLDGMNVRTLPQAAGRSPRNRFLCKWAALRHGFEEDELIYLDTDVAVHADIERLFEETGPEDYHARIEPACHRERYPRLVGLKVFGESQMDHRMYATLCRGMGAAVAPLFNGGVMLYKNGLHRKAAARVSEIERLWSFFASKRLPYPCQVVRVMDEVAGTLALARIPGFCWSELAPELCPFYVERRTGDVADPGVVTHVFSSYYPAFLFETEGPEAAREYLALSQTSTQREWVFSAWVRFGVWRSRFPDWMLEAWASRARGVLG